MGFFKALKKAVKGLGGGDEDFASQVYGLFEEYRSAYASEWQRLENNEKIYRGDHWYDVPREDPNEPQPVTPVIQSTIENVSADLMDSFPEAIIQPESPEDQQIARVLEAVIRQNHDAAAYDREWRKLSHDLLVGGYMVQEVGYDPMLNNGLGGAYIRHVDGQNILFDPLVTDVQESRAVIKFSAKPVKWLDQHYPKHAPFGTDQYTFATPKDDLLTVDETKQTLLLEFWWREVDPATGRYRVHMCKAAGGKIIEDSREQKPEGYFSHGQYPFVVTPLFIRKGSCLGYGFVDMFETQQRYADKLDQIVLKNAVMASRNKLLVTGASGFDADDLRDWSKEVHKGESLNGITWFTTPPLPNYILQYIEKIRRDIKEESGANDFSRGNTGQGVTAASAIMALQEASSKRSRMAARQMHAAYKDAVRMEIEVEREFNVLPREVRMTVGGRPQKATFESALMQRETALGNTIPIEFFISIKVQRENVWTVRAHNELMIQMVQLGILQPPQALELMQFEGRESVLDKTNQADRVSPEEQQARQMQQAQAQAQMAGEMQQIPTPEAAFG
ncbi:MAG: hypothetical protein AAGU74_15230 [Bacillota bacterium]